VHVDEKEAIKVKPYARKTEISGLTASTSYQIRVSATYKDNRKTEGHAIYSNGELNRAEITSVELTKLNPLTLDVHWEMEREAEFKPQVEYQLSATGGNATSIPGNSVMHGLLQNLEPGTEYSLTVTTCYKNGEDKLQFTGQRVFTYNTPQADECKLGRTIAWI
jgi:hypothetical protein